MTELYPNVNNKLREAAETAWKISLMRKNPIDAAEFLNSMTCFYANELTEEEVEFLQFYFNLQMEMMKK